MPPWVVLVLWQILWYNSGKAVAVTLLIGGFINIPIEHGVAGGAAST